MADINTKNSQAKNWMERLSIKRLFSYNNILSNLPFLLYLAMLAVLYIWNSHSAQRNLREMNKLQNELVEYNWEFTSAKSEQNNRTKQSEVSEMVEPLGLKEIVAPPYKIVIDKDEY